MNALRAQNFDDFVGVIRAAVVGWVINCAHEDISGEGGGGPGTLPTTPGGWGLGIRSCELDAGAAFAAGRDAEPIHPARQAYGAGFSGSLVEFIQFRLDLIASHFRQLKSGPRNQISGLSSNWPAFGGLFHGSCIGCDFSRLAVYGATRSEANRMTGTLLPFSLCQSTCRRCGQ